MKVYLLMKHPPYPYDRTSYLKAAEVVGVYAEPKEPKKIAAEKNARQPSYLWTVKAKTVKE